jgi:hypothetical protein
MKMRSVNHVVLLSLLCSAGSFAAADEPRHHGTHEHGGGQLNVVVEKGMLAIELSLPAMNIVGFEHPARTSKERNELRRAAELLRDGVRIFGPSPAAECTLSKVVLESALLEEAGHHDGAGHDGEGHADFDVSYEFNCVEPSRLTGLDLTLFRLFPGTEHLRTQVITPGGQTAVELNAGNVSLPLK